MRHVISLLSLIAVGLLGSTALADVETYVVGVDGMGCPFCAYGIERHLEALEGVESLEIRMQEAEVAVRVSEGSTVTPAALTEAVRRAGFSTRSIRVRGTGDVIDEADHSVAVFSESLRFPLTAFDGEPGRYALSGRLEKRGERWVLHVDSAEPTP